MILHLQRKIWWRKGGCFKLKKDAKTIDYTKLRLADVYLYDSEEEDKQTGKNPDTKEPLKKPKISDAQEFIELIIKEETGIERGLFKRFFSFQMLSAMLKAVYNTVNKNKNRELINVIKSGISDLKDEIKEMSEDQIEIEKQDKIVNIVENSCV